MNAVPGRSLVRHLLFSLRPNQWSKNLVVFAGLLFGRRLLEPVAVAKAVAAFAVFCALSVGSVIGWDRVSARAGETGTGRALPSHWRAHHSAAVVQDDGSVRAGQRRAERVAAVAGEPSGVVRALVNR